MAATTKIYQLVKSHFGVLINGPQLLTNIVTITRRPMMCMFGLTQLFILPNHHFP